MISRGIFRLTLVEMNSCGDVLVLSLNVSDDLAVGAVEAELFTGVSNAADSFTSDLLEVDLVSGDASLS